ncbi:MAG: AmmeMemoRadiSam system protein B [Myxococcales bacterium]
MDDTRKAAVAGTFYPDDDRELADRVDRLVACPQRRVAPKALIAPHAGYVYSGITAGLAFSTLASHADSIRRVVLLGPAHRVHLRGLALPGASAFNTPLGDVPVDSDAVRALEKFPAISTSPVAHAQEHSLEVELPFLQRVLAQFSLVPLVVGDASAETVAEILDALWGGDETLVIVSSDLSHYLPYDRARQVDTATAQAILQGMPLDSHQACGAQAINGFELVARKRGLEAELLDLRSSGDTAGPRREVVGYGAFAFDS